MKKLTFPARISLSADQTHLRILATSDIHGHLLSHDYYADRPTDAAGLAGLASLVRHARAEGPPTLLLDNGDFLQGTPLAELLHADFQADAGAPNAIVAAMNALDYDAAALGNHEFDWGLAYVRAARSQARFPMLAGNVAQMDGPGPGHPLTERSHIVTRQVQTGRGDTLDFRIGLIGLAPAQTAQWDARTRDAALDIADPVESARAEAGRLREAGADIVIAMAHTGVETRPERSAGDNVGAELARVDGIDLLILGHSHVPFPHPDHPVGAGIDPGGGTIHGKPAVNPGAAGTWLGVIDLALAPRGNGWVIAGHDTRLVPVAETLARHGLSPCPEITAMLAPVHARTLSRVRQPIGRTLRPITTHFSRVRPDAAVQIVNAAQRRLVAEALAGTPAADMPVLSAAAPFRSGSANGAGPYVEIPAGPLALRHAADLYPFPNAICAIEITGRQLHDWLERAAATFGRITPGRGCQPLIDPRFPGYLFDVICGVSYSFDLTAPPRFGPNGEVLSPEATRVRDLCHAGRPVTEDQRFVLATNSYRMGGGGHFDVAASAPLLFESSGTASEAIAAYFAANDPLDFAPVRNWGFRPIAGASATFTTAPGAAASLPQPGLRALRHDAQERLVCEIDLDAAAP
ncbi:bifunctional 2',3'-cyclic-nucleotide 2'-phosphodiesterase/3'-nucleotidase [Salibaculum halophilum]|uniref:bifunctional 2',3'-cyclic-nucleotide 2'-phosphodiesterase/3'-nucleotidase n=1 Tax=Salibaculum halophilum TaxID=1914408 RepID=UPI000A0F6C51|nr:bifunctional 2',3'-cyclic-nucleotide 2'-phosphodiesterase/3'-nucleotidase [Salibaculum halophilum]